MPRPWIRIVAWASLCAVFLFTDGPIWLRPFIGYHPNIERFGALFVVALLLGLSYQERLWLTLQGLAIAIAAFEYLQTYVPHRHGTVGDALVKLAGAVAGIALAYVITRLSRTKDRRDHG